MAESANELVPPHSAILKYILADPLQDRYYHLYETGDKDAFFSYTAIKYTRPPTNSPAPVFILHPVNDGWTSNINYNLLLAGSLFRQLDRSLDNVIIIYENLVGLKMGAEREIFWVKGVLEEAHLSIIASRGMDLKGEKAASAWDYQRHIKHIFRLLTREWNDAYLNTKKQLFLKKVSVHVNFETLKGKKDTLEESPEGILARESIGSSILLMEKALFDYAFYSSLASGAKKDIESEIARTKS